MENFEHERNKAKSSKKRLKRYFLSLQDPIYTFLERIGTASTSFRRPVKRWVLSCCPYNNFLALVPVGGEELRV